MNLLFKEYLVDHGLFEWFMERKEGYDEAMENVRISKERVKTGIIWHGQEPETFKCLVNTDGSPAYSTYEEWEKEELEYIEQEQAEADDFMREMREEIERYNQFKKSHGINSNLTYEEVWIGERV